MCTATALPRRGVPPPSVAGKVLGLCTVGALVLLLVVVVLDVLKHGLPYYMATCTALFRCHHVNGVTFPWSYQCVQSFSPCFPFGQSSSGHVPFFLSPSVFFP